MGTQPGHRDDVALRLAVRRQAPLAYFYGLVRGRYAAIWRESVQPRANGARFGTLEGIGEDTCIHTDQ